MTLIAGWLACDQRGPASVYIVSDSRFSWGTTAHYNYGRKLFSLKSSPDILGYCGDVVFSMAAISQVVSLADAGLLFSVTHSSAERSKKIFSQFEIQFRDYPSTLPIMIYHFSRDLDHSFKCYCFSWTTGIRWQYQEIPLTLYQSSLVFQDGSGKDEFKTMYRKYQKGDLRETSRNVFQCFCHTLSTINDPNCGGAPQLVGLYRSKFNGIDFGIIYNNNRYCNGAPINDILNVDGFRWYNSNFEICNGNTLTVNPDAMHQPNPNITMATP